MKVIPFDKRVCTCGGTKFYMMTKMFPMVNPLAYTVLSADSGRSG